MICDITAFFEMVCKVWAGKVRTLSKIKRLDVLHKSNYRLTEVP